MPCANQAHEHSPWPEEGTHEFTIEACENHCGWCDYRTKSSNNLRVHANRHVRNEATLKYIKIVKGTAGRKKLQMNRRRFIASGARKLRDATSGLDEEMKENECDSSAVDYHVESKHESSSTFGTAFSPQSPESSDRALLGPRSSMQKSPLMSEPSAENCEASSTSSISRHAEDLCKRHILAPLNSVVFARGFDSNFHNFIRECDLKIGGGKIICLRDLETTLLNRANELSRSNGSYEGFLRAVLDCITNSWSLFEEQDRIRPGDAPYSASYIENIWESVLPSPQALATQETEKAEGSGDFGGQEANLSSTQQASIPIDAETRVQSISIPVEPRLTEISRHQAPDTDRSVPESFEHPPPPSGPWQPPQDSSRQLPSPPHTFPPPPYENVLPYQQHSLPFSTRGPGHTSTSIVVQRVFESPEDQDYTQNNVNPSKGRNSAVIAQHLWSSSPPPGFPSWTDLGYSEHDFYVFAASFERHLPNDRINTSEQSHALVHSGAARADSRLSSRSITKIQTDILLPLLHKPSLKSFIPLVSFCAGIIRTMQSLRDVERFLLSAAQNTVDSFRTYLAFWNALIVKLIILSEYHIGETNILPDGEKTRPHQIPYCWTYFLDLFTSLHFEDRYTFQETRPWICYDPACYFYGQDFRSRDYLLVHLQHYHEEDAGYFREQDLVSCKIKSWKWRCSTCLASNASEPGWTCQSCKAHCEEPRIKKRRELKRSERVELPPISASIRSGLSSSSSSLSFDQQGRGLSASHAPPSAVGSQTPKQTPSDAPSSTRVGYAPQSPQLSAANATVTESRRRAWSQRGNVGQVSRQIQPDSSVKEISVENVPSSPLDSTTIELLCPVDGCGSKFEPLSLERLPQLGDHLRKGHGIFVGLELFEGAIRYWCTLFSRNTCNLAFLSIDLLVNHQDLIHGNKLSLGKQAMLPARPIVGEVSAVATKIPDSNGLESAAYPQAQNEGEWSMMPQQFRSHRRTPSEYSNFQTLQYGQPLQRQLQGPNALPTVVPTLSEPRQSSPTTMTVNVEGARSATVGPEAHTLEPVSQLLASSSNHAQINTLRATSADLPAGWAYEEDELSEGLFSLPRRYRNMYTNEVQYLRPTQPASSFHASTLAAWATRSTGSRDSIPHRGGLNKLIDKTSESQTLTEPVRLPSMSRPQSQNDWYVGN